MTLLLVVIAALAVGYLRGGRLKRYLGRPLRWVLLPAAGFAIEAALPLIGRLIPVPAENWLFMAVIPEYLAIFVFAALNFERRGMKLILLGSLLNFAVIVANGFKMPLSPVALEMPEAQKTLEMIRAGEILDYVIVGWDAPLLFLGDVIRLPYLPGLASVGDLVLAAGVFLLILEIMGSRRRKENCSMGEP